MSLSVTMTLTVVNFFCESPLMVEEKSLQNMKGNLILLESMIFFSLMFHSADFSTGLKK